MRTLFLPILLLFTVQVVAQKPPKWKDGNFKTTPSGLQYKIVKEGKGEAIDSNDLVEIKLSNYKKSTGLPIYSPLPGKFNKSFLVILGLNQQGPMIQESILLMKKGGKGFFKFPSNSVEMSSDTLFYFIEIKKLSKVNDSISFLENRTDSPDSSHIVSDSVNIVVTDPNKKYFGDTLFAMMKLVEKPQIVSCGISKVLIAFKFETTYFENGMQHKTILVFIECPDFYGKDYFVVGTNYMVTCVPLMDDLKSGSRTMNSYSLEKLDRYYGLRVRKM